jgi:hypothetical protein
MTNTVENALLAINDESKVIRQQEHEIWKKNVQQKYDDLKEREDLVEKSNAINIDGMSVEKLEEARDESRRYLEHAKQSKMFINNDFKSKVPYFGKNIVFIGAKTGQGKSTTAANLAYHDLIQGGHPLLITNEEVTGDVYNRVTCLIKGWNYVEHDMITEEQAKIFDDMMPKLAQRMTVIDDSYCMEYGSTSTLEGIQTICEKLLASPTVYTSIIIDYYQNIETSLKQPYLDVYKVQEKLVLYLDKFKNKYMAPIVMLGQLKEGKDLPFKEAIEGRKIILNKATCAIEMIADRDNWRTIWKIHKSRFTSAIGKEVYTGFERGKYVPYTADFRNKAELRRIQAAQNQLLKGIFVEKQVE